MIPIINQENSYKNLEFFLTPNPKGKKSTPTTADKTTTAKKTTFQMEPSQSSQRKGDTQSLPAIQLSGVKRKSKEVAEVLPLPTAENPPLPTAENMVDRLPLPPDIHLLKEIKEMCAYYKAENDRWNIRAQVGPRKIDPQYLSLLTKKPLLYPGKGKPST